MSTKRYPSMNAISGAIDSHTRALGTAKEKFDIYERQTADIRSSFIQVGDLLDLNILAIDPTGALVLGTAFT